MYSKIQITGIIEVVTGMHIGAGDTFAAIGAVDSSVIKDSISNLPMIPGSSLKGKIRSLLAKRYNETVTEPNNDSENIQRLFGCAKNKVKPSRVLFSDMILINEDELRRKDVKSLTEVKFENSINRATAIANPRQIERVIRGAQFGLDLVYEAVNKDEIIEDIKLLEEGMKLLQYDYLGGSGSRGYGKVKFLELHANVVIGEVDNNIMNEVNEILANL